MCFPSSARSGRKESFPSRLRRLSWSDRALLCESLGCLALARAAVRCLPFRLIEPRLGQRMALSSLGEGPSDEADRVAWAIAAAGRRTPWRSMCLEQAIAAKAMLRRRGIESTLYLGALTEPFLAHAWVRVGDRNVTGGTDVEHYAVLATFAEVDRVRAVSLDR